MAFMGKKKDEVDYNAIDCVVGENSKIKGEFYTSGSAHISGEVEGKIKVEGALFIAESSNIQGEIEGSRVVVSGKVVGNVTARASLEITKTGKVDGDIFSAHLNIEDGAIYNGRVKIAVTNASPEHAPAKFSFKGQKEEAAETAEL